MYSTNELLMSTILPDDIRHAHEVILHNDLLSEELSPAENASNLLFHVLSRHAHALPELDQASIVYAGKTLMKNGAPSSLVPVALQAKTLHPILGRRISNPRLSSLGANGDLSEVAKTAHPILGRQISNPRMCSLGANGDLSEVDSDRQTPGEGKTQRSRSATDSIYHVTSAGERSLARSISGLSPKALNMWKADTLSGNDSDHDTDDMHTPLAAPLNRAGSCLHRERSHSMVVVKSNSFYENTEEVDLLVHAWLRDQYSPSTPLSRNGVTAAHGGRNHDERKASVEDKTAKLRAIAAVEEGSMGSSFKGRRGR